MLEHRCQSVHDTVVGRTAPHSERLISAQQQGDMHVCRRQIRPQLLLFVRSKNMHLYKQQLQSCCTSQTNYETIIKISTIDSVPVHCAIVPDSKSGDQALLLICRWNSNLLYYCSTTIHEYMWLHENVVSSYILA